MTAPRAIKASTGDELGPATEQEIQTARQLANHHRDGCHLANHFPSPERWGVVVFVWGLFEST